MPAIAYRSGPMVAGVDTLIDYGIVPDGVLRAGIRASLRLKLWQVAAEHAAREHQGRPSLVEELRASPIAVQTDGANLQHYEVPPEFYEIALGPQLKYSCCLYESPDSTLAEAEEAMLKLTCERAELADGQRILELGCGWGSLTLYMAARYPNADIVAVSNSSSQRAFIQRKAAERGLANVRVCTADMNDFDPRLAAESEAPFDRVVSVEMFEHMRNYGRLLERISSWLTAEGKLFVHIFTTRRFGYLFDVDRSSDWFSKRYFAGGTMPSDRLLYDFQDHLRIEQQWQISGAHYQRTSEDWLARMDARSDELDALFRRVYGDESRRRRLHWRLFFLFVAEAFGFHGGREWFVSHYRFAQNRAG